MANRMRFLSILTLTLSLGGCTGVVDDSLDSEANERASQNMAGFTCRSYALRFLAKNLPQSDQTIRLSVELKNFLSAHLYNDQCQLIPADRSSLTVDSAGFADVGVIRVGAEASLGLDMGSNIPILGNLAKLTVHAQKGTFTDQPSNGLMDKAADQAFGLPIVPHFNPCKPPTEVRDLSSLGADVNQDAQLIMTRQDALFTDYEGVLKVDFASASVEILPIAE
jgi:hypothetical protein